MYWKLLKLLRKNVKLGFAFWQIREKVFSIKNKISSYSINEHETLQNIFLYTKFGLNKFL